MAPDVHYIPSYYTHTVSQQKDIGGRKPRIGPSVEVEYGVWKKECNLSGFRTSVKQGLQTQKGQDDGNRD